MIRIRSQALRVLVADDVAGNRAVMRAILHSAGAAVRCVENGREAVDAAAAERFDLILIDQAMPVMDGLTAVRRIRAFERVGGRSAAPIFVVTSHDTSGDKAAACDAGADGHIAKPFRPRDILAAVETARAIRGRRRVEGPGRPQTRRARRTFAGGWAWAGRL